MLERWKKNLLHLPQEKANFSKIDGGGGGRGGLSVENLGLFFQSSGKVKQEIIIRNGTHKLPHKLSNNLGLMIVGNEELLIKALMI